MRTRTVPVVAVLLLAATPLSCSLVVDIPAWQRDGETTGEDIDGGVRDDAAEEGDRGGEDADAREDAEPEDNAADDAGPQCGNGVVDPGEECDSAAPEVCTTTCGTAGGRECADCMWSACVSTTLEACNDIDDDCDGMTDERFPCRRGQLTTCTTACGTSGSTVCSDTCAIESCSPPADTCNGVDDDCDGGTDDENDCRRGAPVACTTSCGTAGSGFCSSTCTMPPGEACAPPPETCNGADDDCDGATDEGLWSASAPDLRITATTDRSVRPALAWHAATHEFGLAWEEETTPSSDGSVYFALLDESGTRVPATDATIAAAAGASRHGQPALVWSNPQWGLVWSQNDSGPSELHFRWASADGATLGPDVQVTSAVNRSDEPAMVWSGTEYGVAWNDSRDGNLEVYFTRLTTSGSKPGGYTDERLSATTTCASSRPTVAWTGTEYGVAWYEFCGTTGDPGDIYFARVTAAGRQVAGSSRGAILGSGSQHAPRLVWNGTGYGMVFLDDSVGCYEQVYFARLNSDGVNLGMPVPLTTCADTNGVDGAASLAWDAGRNEWAVAWSDQRNAAETCGAAACGTEIYFLRLTPAGGAIDAPLRVTIAPGASSSPVLANRGDGIGLAWVDERDGNPEIYFNVLACGP